MAEVRRVNEECPAGCCPHVGVSQEEGCPADLPGAPQAERIAHLYACQMLSTYKIGKVTGIDRQKVTSLLHKAGVVVKPHGAGRHKRRPSPADRQLDEIMARLYLTERLTSIQIADLAGLPDHTVRDRLRAKGVPIR